MLIKRLLTGVFVLCLPLACNNYNLVEKLENLGGERYSDRLFIFVTSQTTQGDMSGLSSGSCSGSGLGRADCVCTALAAQYNLRMGPDRRFIAWLSTATDWTRCRITGVSGSACTPTGPSAWYNTAMQPVFISFENATTGLLASPSPALPNAPKFTETGSMAPAVASDVWTGTALSGVSASGDHCSNWTVGTSAVMGVTGTSMHTGTSWTGTPAANCDLMKRVYCVAQP